MTQLRRIIFAGGGTGGHLFPGIAVAEELRLRHPDLKVLFTGSDRSTERRILRDAQLPHESLPIRPAVDLMYSPFQFIRSFLNARREAFKLVRAFGPQVVVGLGGFASVPVIRAAYWRGIPCVLLEQNIVPGRATNWLSNYAVTVCHSFQASVPPTDSKVKHVVTGNPVRKEIVGLSDSVPEPDPDKPDLSGVLASSNTVRTILVLGGSQGAHAVNEMWLECVEQLKEPFTSLQILHQTGESDCDWVRKSYKRLGMSAIAEPFFEFLPTLYRQADLVISRAGATTLAELACAGIPAVLIPYPGSMGDHQLKNAEYFALAGGCRIVHQPKPEETSTLTKVVASVMSEPLDVMRSAMLSKAKPDAAQKVSDEIEAVVEKLVMSSR